MVIGEFSAAKAGGDWTIGGLYEAAVALGYAGAWDWALVGGGEDGNDDADAAYEGMRAVRDAAGVRVEIGGGGGGGRAIARMLRRTAATRASSRRASGSVGRTG